MSGFSRRFAVLAAEDSWYARDLRRAAGNRFEVVTVPFSELNATIEGGKGAPAAFSAAFSAATKGSDRVASGEWDLRAFDAVLVRTMPPGSLEQVLFRMNALGQLAAAGQVVVNPPRSLEIAVDKYLTSSRLRAAGFATPRTWVGQTAESALAAWSQLGGDVVVKPLFGGEGRGILRVSDPDLALRAFSTLERLGAVMYLQEYVPHLGYDLRLFVLGNHALGHRVLGMKRLNDSDWRTNVARGARTEPIEVTDELRSLALRAQEVVGTEVSGVDLLPARDGTLYAIEVNAVPGWKSLARTLDRDVAELVLDYVWKRTVEGT